MTSTGASALATNNFITFASNYGNQHQHWNGFDVTASSRLPELLTPAAGLSALQNCHFVSGWAPRYKMLASYVLPWQNIRVSGNLQSLPGPVRQAAVI